MTDRQLISSGGPWELIVGYGEHFHDVRPANTTVVVKALMNPAWKVEVEVDAVIASAPSFDR